MLKLQIQNPNTTESKLNPKSRIPKKLPVILICNFVLFVICILGIGNSTIFAQNENNIDELRESYLRENKYNEFVDYLKSQLTQKKYPLALVKYNIALARYYELKNLEDKQLWDEYFNQGSSYKEELNVSVHEAINSTTSKDALNIYARLLLWEFYKTEDDASVQDVLTDLKKAVIDYAKDAQDLKPLKLTADKLLLNGEKSAAKELYVIYTAKITGPDVKDEDLKSLAAGFFKEGNLDLAESVYDAFIERMVKAGNKDNLIKELSEIAKMFSYSDKQPNDPFYAEKIFEKIASIAGADALDENLLYLRAYNLEKSKEYKRAREIYIELVKSFPNTTHLDEALFKIAMINVYALRDIQAGRDYFTKLSEKETVSPQVISALYHLGLLAQWEADFSKAKSFYEKAITLAKEQYKDTIVSVRMRLKEIEENKPIEENLRIFLDASLKPENIRFDMSKAGLRTTPTLLKSSEESTIGSAAVTEASGCMQVVIEYRWSGNTGAANPPLSEPGFKTSYTEPGTKEIFLVLMSPPDLIDRDFIMVDVR